MIRLKFSISLTVCLLPLCVSAAETTTYSYDAKGRLVTATRSGTIDNNIQSVYAHDNADNRQSVSIGPTGLAPSSGSFAPKGPTVAINTKSISVTTKP
jgi:hypothetical protein